MMSQNFRAKMANRKSKKGGRGGRKRSKKARRGKNGRRRGRQVCLFLSVWLFYLCLFVCEKGKKDEMDAGVKVRFVCISLFGCFTRCNGQDPVVDMNDNDNN